MRAVLALVIAALALVGCGREEERPAPAEPDRLTLAPVAFADLPGWEADAMAEALPAVRRSCARLMTLPPERDLGANGIAGVVADWHDACAAAELVPDDDHPAARRYFETWFAPFRAANGEEPTGLFTGYFEPELRGALRPDERHRTPIHRRPDDLVMVELGQFREELKGERIAGRVVDGSLRPFASRAEIDAGALSGDGLELVWVDDPVDAFFLHIQGSGRVVFQDGSVMRLGYAAQNGHPYFAIGRELIARGELTREEVSLQSIRAWIAANPEEGPELMARNPSYIFFRELADEGPVGAQGVVLTSGRSIAVDRRFVPLSVPVWLDAEHPDPANARIQRLLVAQDTGGAIRGPVRGDYFWGSGDEAAEHAGAMKSNGSYYLLLPRAVVSSTAGR